MPSRRNKLPPYDEHIRQSPGMVHPDATHPMGPLPPPQILEQTLMSQEAEIEQLARDNHKLSSSHLGLRQDLVVAQQEADKLRDHIRSIQTEGDIQVRILLDKIAKAEANIGAGENIKKELQDAHIEAQRLETTRQDLNARIQQATIELENSCEDLKRLPEMHAELDNLRQEHQRLRKSFEYEKGLNSTKVEQLKTLEKDLILMVEGIERLRAEVSNAEKRASAPPPPPSPPPPLAPLPFHGHFGYVDNFGTPYPTAVGNGAPIGGMNPYSSTSYTVGPLAVNAPVAGDPYWGGTYDAPRPH